MAKETIGIEGAVRLTLVERGDIPPLELVALREQRYGLKLDARFLIIKTSLRQKAQSEAQRAALRSDDGKPAPRAGDSDTSSCTERSSIGKARWEHSTAGHLPLDRVAKGRCSATHCTKRPFQAHRSRVAHSKGPPCAAIVLPSAEQVLVLVRLLG
jgi:hypothetical protein